jgi:hypothetical protein
MIAADIIRGLHILLVCFLVLAGFSKNSLIILLNLVLMVSIMFHWIVNNNICCLTVCEKLLRGVEDDAETFFGNLIGPVYSAHSNEYSWILILILFSFNLYQMYNLRADLYEKIRVIKSM